MASQIIDESIFLRIHELKNGNIQFTDSTNASRLLRNTDGISATFRHGRNGLSGIIRIGKRTRAGLWCMKRGLSRCGIYMTNC